MTRRRLNLIALTTTPIDGLRCPNPVLEGLGRAGFSVQPGRTRSLRGQRGVISPRRRRVGQKTRQDQVVDSIWAPLEGKCLRFISQMMTNNLGRIVVLQLQKALFGGLQR